MRGREAKWRAVKCTISDEQVDKWTSSNWSRRWSPCPWLKRESGYTLDAYVNCNFVAQVPASGRKRKEDWEEGSGSDVTFGKKWKMVAGDIHKSKRERESEVHTPLLFLRPMVWQVSPSASPTAGIGSTRAENVTAGERNKLKTDWLHSRQHAWCVCRERGHKFIRLRTTACSNRGNRRRNLVPLFLPLSLSLSLSLSPRLHKQATA